MAVIEPPLPVAGPPSSLTQAAGAVLPSEPHPCGTTTPLLLMAPWASTQAVLGGLNELVRL